MVVIVISIMFVACGNASNSTISKSSKSEQYKISSNDEGLSDNNTNSNNENSINMQYKLKVHFIDVR